MTFRRFVVASAFAVAGSLFGFAVGSVAASSDGSDGAAVEYKVVDTNAEMPNFEATLNAMGRDGWRLVLVEMADGKYIFMK